MDMIDLHPSLAEAPIGHKGRVNDSWSDIPESGDTCYWCGQGCYPSCWPAFLEKGLIPAEDG